MWVFVRIILSVYRVRGRNHTTSGIKGSMNTSFGDSNGLLLHNLVDGYPVDVAHLIKFVYTHNSPIS